MKEWLQFIGMVFSTTLMVAGSLAIAAIIIISLLPDREFKKWDKDLHK